MRYIPSLASDIIVQVPEDKNAYINVRNIGASGRGDLEFTGTVTDIDAEGVVTISNIDDGEGGSIFQYADLLKQGAELQVFGYRSSGAADTASITVSGHEEAGNVDFSTSLATNPNLAQLTYYVFGYNATTGVMVNHTEIYQVGTKILNPDLWNTEQNIKLNFSRTSGNVLPILYRVWGTSINFLGVIGNNKAGYPGTGITEFLDLGNTEIPFWESAPELPSFLSDVFSVGGSQVDLIKKITAKETFTILPKPFGSQTSYIQCSGLSANSGLVAGDTVRFVIDDTKYIQLSIATAASGQIKEIFFPAGIYNIRDTFFANSFQTNYSNLSIRGVGDGTILRRLPSTVSNPSYPGLFNFTGQAQDPRVSGIRIRSIAFNGNRSESFSTVSPSTSETTLQIKNADNVVISDCTVFDSGGGGIALYTSKGVSLTGNKILRTGRSYEQPASPLLIDTGENVVVQGNQMEFATTGPKAISTEYSTINGNIIRACGDQGFVLETSSQWNAQGNLAYSDNDSLIRSVDTYNNEYSRATIEVRKGFALDPIYMTVTYGGESVGIAKNSVQADIYNLDADGVKTGTSIGSLRVLETSNQLEAGIFSLTLPGGTTNQTVNAKTILATGNLTNPLGYMYEVSGSVLIGSFRPLSISPITVGGNQYLSVQLRNSSDMLGFQIYSESDVSQNDRIYITGFSNTNLSGWDQNSSYPILNLNTDTNSILIGTIAGLTITDTVEFLGGTLSILRPNYFIADGNLLVHS
jgi:parallel beta-helix repeat protein